MKKTNVVINLQIEGFHCWPQAKEVFPEVAFLSDNHRHIFHICAKKKVHHDDRDVEIIMLKKELTDYLYEQYGVQQGPDSHYKWLKLGSKSCEMLARELMEHFDLDYCSVLEDNENGAEIFKN